MAEFKVLITTSGIGSRLGDLTNYTNKCLVRVGKKPAISYIIENYSVDTEFIITCGHHSQQVKDFVKLAYPNHNIKFVDIDKYTGPGSSLGYSMLQAKEYLQCPFIFHAADTIVEGEIPIPTSNWIGYSKKENYSQYRTIDLINPKIFEKGHIGSDLAYIGLCGINDFSNFWASLENEYSLNRNDISLSDCHAINKMINKNWKFINFSRWYDIGNVSELHSTREKISDKFHILDKVDESIFLFDEFVIKFFYNKEICLNRVKRCSILSDLTPNIVDYTDNFYKYEKVNGHLLSDVIDEVKFTQLLNWSKEKLWLQYDKVDDKFKNKVHDFYFVKTNDRLKRYFEKNNINDEPEIINGFAVPTIKEMIDLIDKNWLCDVTPYQFHGDFILDNIIIDDDGIFKLIDWRQDFSGLLTYGDMYYDLAKLNHNLLFNHEIVTKENFFVEISDKSVRFDILRSDNLTNCKELLYNFIIENNLDLKRVKLLTAIIWLNMAPLHEPKIGRLLYYLGKLNLYKLIYD